MMASECDEAWRGERPQRIVGSPLCSFPVQLGHRGLLASSPQIIVFPEVSSEQQGGSVYEATGGARPTLLLLGGGSGPTHHRTHHRELALCWRVLTDSGGGTGVGWSELEKKLPHPLCTPFTSVLTGTEMAARHLGIPAQPAIME